MKRQRSWRVKLGHMFCKNRELDRRLLCMKKNLDQVAKILCGEKKKK